MLEILETLGGYFGCDGGGGADVFLSREGGRECYSRSASERRDADIYNLCPRAK